MRKSLTCASSCRNAKATRRSFLTNGRLENSLASSTRRFGIRPTDLPIDGLKSKDLIGIPWRVAFALQADGWFLRSDIIWAKPNAMPESVTDRPSKAHEYIFLLSKNARYFYDSDAIAEPASKPVGSNGNFGNKDADARLRSKLSGNMAPGTEYRTKETKNKRSVWTVNTQPYAGAHFAVFPPLLIEPCILAGSKRGDVVLDPFCGSGTTASVAITHGRRFIGCELNADYVPLIRERVNAAIDAAAMPLFADAFAAAPTPASLFDAAE